MEEYSPEQMIFEHIVEYIKDHGFGTPRALRVVGYEFRKL